MLEDDAAADDEAMQGQVGGIPRGMYIKLQLAQQNRNAADAVRLERKQLDELKQKGLDEQAARIERLRAKREQRHTEAAEQHRKHIAEVSNGVREQVKQAEAQRKELLEAHWKEARVRVEIANNLDAKLDAKEAAQDQREREEAAGARAKLAGLAAAAKAKEEAKRASLNEKVRKGREANKERKAASAEGKRRAVQATKEAKDQWGSSANANRVAHLEVARAKAKRRAEEKATARDRNEARARQRREAAREEKANNAVATAVLEGEVKANQRARAKSYARRYVPTSAVEELEASDTFRRLYGLPDADGKIKSIARALPPKPPPSLLSAPLRPKRLSPPPNGPAQEATLDLT